MSKLMRSLGVVIGSAVVLLGLLVLIAGLFLRYDPATREAEEGYQRSHGPAMRARDGFWKMMMSEEELQAKVDSAMWTKSERPLLVASGLMVAGIALVIGSRVRRSQKSSSALPNVVVPVREVSQSDQVTAGAEVLPRKLDSASGSHTVEQRLAKLKELLCNGHITDQEYATRRERIISEL